MRVLTGGLWSRQSVRLKAPKSAPNTLYTVSSETNAISNIAFLGLLNHMTISIQTPV